MSTVSAELGAPGLVGLTHSDHSRAETALRVS